MKLTIQSQQNGVCSLRLEGTISQRDVIGDREPLATTLGQDAFGQNVLFDMSEVSAIDSSGINWLLNCQKKVRESGGCLVLHSLSPIAKNVIRVLNLQTVFALADNLTQAETLVHGESG